MLGTLLDDLKSGATVDEARRRFDAKMHPLRYQRPQAAPSAGNIARAEALVKELGIEPSLRRRYARFEDLRGFIWQPQMREAVPTGGVFDHLKKTQPADRGPISCGDWTWTRFAREILPTVATMDLRVPSSLSPFIAIVTAANPEATPILQWDTADERNPVSWYLYVNGSYASQWNLAPETFVSVRGVVKNPAHWDHPDRFTHQAEHAMLVLMGARDIHAQRAGLALFPEILKSELREVRSVIEAHSQQGTIEDTEAASACGLLISSGQKSGRVVRVTRMGQSLAETYRIDRWE
jgi:hypothetical protein